MEQKLIDLLKSGYLAVVPTDTVYGLLGTALQPKTVERIYKLRKRSKDKPFIILISSLSDLNIFDIKLSDKQKEFLQKKWPNPLSVILPVGSEEFEYLHRGRFNLAFRMPKDKRLLKILQKTGPLIAPSANVEGEKTAQNINRAKKYFGKKVSFYLDGGIIKSQPSTLIKLNQDGSWEILRQGIFKI